jgi:hypothetical protein
VSLCLYGCGVVDLFLTWGRSLALLGGARLSVWGGGYEADRAQQGICCWPVNGCVRGYRRMF